MPRVPELEELNRIRLDEDLSFRELEEQMAATGFWVSYATLQTLLTSEDPQPYDRTLHKIRRFLEERNRRSAAPTKRRARA